MSNWIPLCLAEKLIKYELALRVWQLAGFELGRLVFIVHMYESVALWELVCSSARSCICTLERVEPQPKCSPVCTYWRHTGTSLNLKCIGRNCSPDVAPNPFIRQKNLQNMDLPQMVRQLARFVLDALVRIYYIMGFWLPLGSFLYMHLWRSRLSAHWKMGGGKRSD